jgi:hypothetical protein
MNWFFLRRSFTKKAMKNLESGGLCRQVRQLINMVFWGLVVMFILGIFGEIVRSQLIRWDEPMPTLLRIRESAAVFDAASLSFIMIIVLDVFLAVSFYMLFRVHHKPTAISMLSFRLIYVAIKASAIAGLFLARDIFNAANINDAVLLTEKGEAGLLFLKLHQYGFGIGLFFFGIHLILLAVLIRKARIIPNSLLWLLFFGGAGYCLNSLASFFIDDENSLRIAIIVVFLIPMTFSELLVAWWMKKKRSAGVENPFPYPA